MSLSAAGQHADRVEERDGATAEETAYGDGECRMITIINVLYNRM